MAESLTLHGAKDIKRHIGGTDITRINPKRGGDTHMIRRWWGGAGKALYEPCVVFKVARTAGELRLVVPIKESTRLTITYDGTDGFTFTGAQSIDRIGVFDSNLSFCEEYLLPHIVGGKQMKRTVKALPSPAPAQTIGTVTITGSATPTHAVASTYTASISGTATGETYAWTSNDGSVVFTAQTAKSTDVTFSAAKSFDLTVTVTKAGATGSPKSKTLSVTAA